MSKIYIASRASVPERSAEWRRLRSKGWPIVSSWIDEAGPGQSSSLSDLWTRVQKEVAEADVTIVYAEKDDFPLKGTLIEAGMALALGKPIFVVLKDVDLDPVNLRPIGSWITHPSVVRVSDMETALAMTTRLNLYKPMKPGERSDNELENEIDRLNKKIADNKEEAIKLSVALSKAKDDHANREIKKTYGEWRPPAVDAYWKKVVEIKDLSWSPWEKFQIEALQKAGLRFRGHLPTGAMFEVIGIEDDAVSGETLRPIMIAAYKAFMHLYADDKSGSAKLPVGYFDPNPHSGELLKFHYVSLSPEQQIGYDIKGKKHTGDDFVEKVVDHTLMYRAHGMGLTYDPPCEEKPSPRRSWWSR